MKLIRNLFTKEVSLDCAIENNFSKKVEEYKKVLSKIKLLTEYIENNSFSFKDFETDLITIDGGFYNENNRHYEIECIYKKTYEKLFRIIIIDNKLKYFAANKEEINTMSCVLNNYIDELFKYNDDKNQKHKQVVSNIIENCDKLKLEKSK